MAPEVSVPRLQEPAICSYLKPDQPSTCHHRTSWRSIVLLSSHLRLGLRSVLFPSGFPTKTLYSPLLFPIRSTCHTHLILLELITRIIFGEVYWSVSSSLCSFLYSSITSSLLGPNILVSTLFSDTLSLHSSLNINDQVSHPYDTTGKITALYIWIFSYFYLVNWKTKYSAPNDSNHSLISIPS